MTHLFRQNNDKNNNRDVTGQKCQESGAKVSKKINKKRWSVKSGKVMENGFKVG